MRKTSLVVLALLVFTAASARAGETGSVSGKVADASGGALPGVLVKISGPQLPGGRSTGTSSSGAYNFQRLLPGKYTVEAELSGLGKASRAVEVLVDNDYQADLVLRGGAESTVEVTAAAVDVKSAEVDFNYKREEINNLPLQRTFSGLVQLAPGIPDPETSQLDPAAGTGFSAAGGTRQDNKFLIDGVNITNPGYGVLLVETNELDIVDFNVKRGGISAEFGRTSGVILNAVTRSGTNDFHGGARFEALPDAFIADPYNTTSTQKVDRYTGAANLGFPVVKDMLFGYASGRYFSSTKSGQSGLSGQQPDTKIKNGDIFGKLTAQPAQSLQLNASFRALPTKSDNQFDSINDAVTAAYNTDVTNYITNVTGNWFPTGNTFVEAKYVHLTEHDTADAQNVLRSQPKPLPQTRITNPDGSFSYSPLGQFGYFADPTKGGGNVGVAEFITRGDDYKRDEVKLSASQFLDLGPTQHQIKVGGAYENDDYSLIRETNGWGLFALTSGNEIRARYYTLQPEQTGKARTYSAFLQDTITWNRLSVNVGVLFNKDDFAQVALDGTRYNFMTFNWGDEVQPRLGIAYNADLVKGDKFYGSYGRYYGLDQKSTSRSFAPFRIRQDQSFFDRATGAFKRQQIRGSSAGKFIPRDLKPPYTDELVAGYAAPVTNVVSVELFGQYRQTRDIFEDVPIDPNAYGTSLFEAANLPNARRRYRAITLDVTKRLSSRWAADVSYTYSRLDGNFDLDYSGIDVFNTSSIIEDAPGINSAEPNRYGQLSQDRPHIFKAFGSYDTPIGITLGGYFRLQSGAAWEARGQDGNGSYYRYLEPAGSRRLPTQANVDLLAAYNFRLGAAVNLRAEARVLNVFNTQTPLTVDKIQYFDSYKDGTPPSTLGPQGTTQPNANFGRYLTFAQPRRLVLTAIVEF
jgi:hypothetical protein